MTKLIERSGWQVNRLTLTAQEVEASDYTVSLTANYYEEPLSATSNPAKDDSGEVTLTAPTVEKAKLTQKERFYLKSVITTDCALAQSAAQTLQHI